ncbi:MAG: 50S ribosomal protein L4 [Bdellovibrionia bacterium]
MAKAKVVNWDNKKVDDIELPEDVFGVEVRKDVLHTVVRWQLASRRAGTHQTKTKGLVSGGGKKPFKQKGTGQARQGSSRSILMPGGGTAFGPQPRDYSYALPKKVRKLGLKSALSHLVKEGKLVVVEDMKSTSGKTKELVGRLKALGTAKSLLVDSNEDKVFKRAAGNLGKFRYIAVGGLNVFDLLKYGHAVVTRASVETIAARCR